MMLSVSGIVCLVLAYMAVRSWKEYRMACENLKQIEKITQEMKAYEEKRKQELEAILNDSVETLMDVEMIELGGRMLHLYSPLHGSMLERQPR